ncbi:MAG: endospore germination permease [Bacillota bacterium]|nr:endospore germination permease [Bacillota bacterium]
MSDTQVSMLMFLMIMATVILFVPSITAQEAGVSAWMVPLIVPTLAGYLTVWMACKLEERFSGLTLVQYGELILGKLLGKPLGCLYILFLFILDVLVIREFAGFFSVTMLPNTPILVLNLTVVLVGGYAALQGIEVIGRMTQFVLPLFVLSFLLLISLVLPDADFGFLQPLLGDGVMPIVKSTVVPASWYGEIGVLVLLLPMVNKTQGVKRKGFITLLAVACFLTLDIFVTQIVFGAEQTASFMFPFFELAEYVEIGDIIQRIESLISIMWITGIVVKAALFTYLISLGVSQVLGLKTYRLVVYALMPLQLILGTYPAISALNLSRILAQYWPLFGLFFEVVVPLFLLMVAFLRNMRLGGSG